MYSIPNAVILGLILIGIGISLIIVSKKSRSKENK